MLIWIYKRVRGDNPIPSHLRQISYWFVYVSTYHSVYVKICILYSTYVVPVTRTSWRWCHEHSCWNGRCYRCSVPLYHRITVSSIPWWRCLNPSYFVTHSHAVMMSLGPSLVWTMPRVPTYNLKAAMSFSGLLQMKGEGRGGGEGIWNLHLSTALLVCIHAYMLFPTCLKWTQFAHPSIHSDPKVFIPLILITYYCLGDQVVVLSLVVGRSGSGSVEKSRVVCDPAVHPFCQ